MASIFSILSSKKIDVQSGAQSNKSPTEENKIKDETSFTRDNADAVLSGNSLDNLFFSRTQKLEDFFREQYNLDVTHILSGNQGIKELSFSEIQEKLSKVIRDCLSPSKELDYLLCSPKTYSKLKSVVSSRLQEAVMIFRKNKKIFNKDGLSENVCQGLTFLILNNFLVVNQITENNKGKPSCKINEFDTTLLKKLYLQLLEFSNIYLCPNNDISFSDMDSINLLLDKIIVSSKLLSYINAKSNDKLKNNREQILLLLSKLLEEGDGLKTINDLDCSRLEQYLLSDIYGIKLNKRLYELYQKSECKNFIDTKCNEAKKRTFLPMIFSFGENIFFAENHIPFQKLLDYIFTTDTSSEKEKSIISFLNSLGTDSIIRIGDEDLVFIFKNNIENISYGDLITKDDLNFIKIIASKNIPLSVLMRINYQEFQKLYKITDDKELTYILESKNNFDNYFLIQSLELKLTDDLLYIPSYKSEYAKIKTILGREYLYASSLKDLKTEIGLIYNTMFFEDTISFNKKISEGKQFLDMNKVFTNFYLCFKNLTIENCELLMKEIFSHSEDDILFLLEIFQSVPDYDYISLVGNIGLLLSLENREDLDVSMGSEYVSEWVDFCISSSKVVLKRQEGNLANNIKNIFGDDDGEYILKRFKNRQTVTNIIKVGKCLKDDAILFSQWLKDEEKLNPKHIDNIYSALKFFLNFNINHFQDVSKIFSFIAKGNKVEEKLEYLHDFFHEHTIKDYMDFKSATIKYLKPDGVKRILEQYINACEISSITNENDYHLMYTLNNGTDNDIDKLAEKINQIIANIKSFGFIGSATTSSTETNNSRGTGTFINTFDSLYINPLQKSDSESSREYLSRISTLSFNFQDFNSLEDIRDRHSRTLFQQAIDTYGTNNFYFFQFLEELGTFMSQSKMGKSRGVNVSGQDAHKVYMGSLDQALGVFSHTFK